MQYKSLAHPLQLLYTASLNTGEIPLDLKLAIITPINKGGSRDVPNNYQPVSLISHLIKIWKKYLQFFFSLIPRNTSENKPHGFRSGRSCLSKLLEEHHNIFEELEKSNNVYVIYLDFTKAFDNVDDGILLNKFKKLGINGEVRMWIHNFLSNKQLLVTFME